MTTAIERMQGGLSSGTARALGGGYASIAAAGSAQGDATPVKSSLVLVGSANGTKGVILPSGQAGDVVTLINNSASTLLVYPDSGSAITVPGTSLGSANTAYSQVTYAIATYTRLTSTQWAVVTSAGFSGTTASFTTVTADAIAGGDASLGITGLAAAQGGAVVATGGTSSTSGNAGGASSIVGGTPGATGIGGAANVTGAAGGATSGKGGNANITAGAGTAGNADGGDVVITAGAAHGSGAGGVILERSVKLVKQGTPTAKTVSATLTAAEVLAGIITVNQAAASTSEQQLPLASAMDTALPTSAAGDAFDFSVINTSTVDAEDASVTTNTGWTLVGSMDIHAYSAAGSLNSSARFRARKTGTGAWTLYRIA